MRTVRSRARVCVSDKDKGSERMSGPVPGPRVGGHCSTKMQAGEQEAGSVATVYGHNHFGSFLWRNALMHYINSNSSK